MEVWRNGFSQAAVQTVQLLIDESDEIVTAADMKDIINQYLSKVAVSPGTEYDTYAYQWAEWLDNGAEKKVSATFNTF